MLVRLGAVVLGERLGAGLVVGFVVPVANEPAVGELVPFAAADGVFGGVLRGFVVGDELVLDDVAADASLGGPAQQRGSHADARAGRARTAPGVAVVEDQGVADGLNRGAVVHFGGQGVVLGGGHQRGGEVGHLQQGVGAAEPQPPGPVRAAGAQPVGSR